MKTLKTLGILYLVFVALTFLCVFGEAESAIIGFYGILTFGLGVALSIVGTSKQ